MKTFFKIVALTVVAAIVTAAAIAAYGTFRLATGPSSNIEAGSNMWAGTTVLCGTGVLIIGASVCIFYVAIRLVKRAWQE